MSEKTQEPREEDDRPEDSEDVRYRRQIYKRIRERINRRDKMPGGERHRGY